MSAAGQIAASMNRPVAYWYRLVRVEFGRIEQGNQLVYVRRNM
jgi:hypothetical protein